MDELLNIFSRDINETIKSSIDPYRRLKTLNKIFAEYEFNEKEIKQIVNGLNLEPDLKNLVLKEQLRLFKFNEKQQKDPYLYNNLEWNKNGKKINSSIEKSQTDKRKLNDIKSNIKVQNQNSDRLSKKDLGQQMEF